MLSIFQEITMDIIWIICGSLVVIYYFLLYYLKTTVWCRSQTCLVGKTVIVTGANTGVGYETALDFAKRGASVILACRDEHEAEQARTNIIEATNNENVAVKIVNFASFDSVRAFANEINKEEKCLDVLVNNAGAGGLDNKKSEDGLPLSLQVNYLASFLLTNLLIGLLKKSTRSRVINVSSAAAKMSNLDLDHFDTSVGDFDAHANSKLCQILFTMELAEKLKGTGITTYSVHPGFVRTDFFGHLQGYTKRVVDFLKENFCKTPEEGAQSVIYAAVARGIEEFSGQHFDNCERVEPYETTKVPGLVKKLWEKSERFVELKPEEMQF